MKIQKIPNTKRSKILFGNTGGIVSPLLTKEELKKELSKIFPDLKQSLILSLEEAWKSSFFKNEKFEDFVYAVAVLTTRQISFFVYIKYFLKKDISYKRATPYNKKPVKYDWYKVGNREILMYDPKYHLRYVKAYLGM